MRPSYYHHHTVTSSSSSHQYYFDYVKMRVFFHVASSQYFFILLFCFFLLCVARSSPQSMYRLYICILYLYNIYWLSCRLLLLLWFCSCYVSIIIINRIWKWNFYNIFSMGGAGDGVGGDKVVHSRSRCALFFLFYILLVHIFHLLLSFYISAFIVVF